MMLETETPDAAFEVRLDRGPWVETQATWDWPLREGLDIAEVRTRNGSGVYRRNQLIGCGSLTCEAGRCPHGVGRDSSGG